MSVSLIWYRANKIKRSAFSFLTLLFLHLSSVWKTMQKWSNKKHCCCQVLDQSFLVVFWESRRKKWETRSINQSSLEFLLGIKLNRGNSGVMGLRAEFRHLLGILAVSGADGQLHGEGEKGKERERGRDKKSLNQILKVKLSSADKKVQSFCNEQKILLDGSRSCCCCQISHVHKTLWLDLVQCLCCHHMACLERVVFYVDCYSWSQRQQMGDTTNSL